ncbi:MAG: superoxide dismutase [Prolixibacteraceae bacterium]|jgi:superoxide dismutase, Fe-Mn family|nr:superoxide dismutase [Prolixibacteraceae bacterium]MBT6006787.1 superoxide dismutase [Prolixibacteraceae bacterium]MBT6766080.1 superoxide dismutase [Prolixibacteraceae bacterium]MBT6999287.1 superoxide dismutase [Prolixibacteraceae bacterium]MBT7396380.1 superoxide dismutase [Prolixibacteraceae bacterium]
MAFELPELPYAKNALEPFISEKTLDFHYGKHHQAYVNNVNNLAKGTEFENASLEEIIMKTDGGIFNNGAQVWNHTFYFMQFNPDGCDTPKDNFKTAIEAKFGSVESFKEQFSKAAVTLFGSGWAWLTVNEEGELEIVQTSNAGNPLRINKKPLLTCDVWEHAYYIDKKNARPKYIEDFWKILDWKVISERFAE